MADRNLLNYIVISLKGMAMGAADVVPGVSGGTIAFISGIYEELITTISGVRFSLLKIWRDQGFKAFWKALNGNFILALFIGIAVSILTLAKLISYLLLNEPILLWSFFFGLVVASIFFVAKSISKWTIAVAIVMAIGAVLAFYITTLSPTSASGNLPYLMLSGALAICAMILPGISGAFILVLLGSYETVLNAVHERDFQILGIVALGAIVGILSFSRILKWLFSRYHDLTLAGLTGFIIGSLNKIWPWKEAIETRVIDNEIVILKEKSISPIGYEGDPQIAAAIVLAILGFVVIFALERLAVKKEA